MAALTLDGVTKWFTEKDGNRIVAVDDATVGIEDGEFLVLVGPSGCGKSTTLRMIAGLETVSQGQIRLGDRVINDQQPKDRDIAMVFQSYALYPHMTVRGNMSFGLEESTDMPKDEIRSRVEETAGMLGISELLDRKPGELSGGQQQRVALGRAIVRDPAVFLMDEPLSNLDAKLRSQMRTELQRLQEDLDVTTVYVTHDQTEAMTMGDRIAILNDGVLQQVATPLEAYHQPANRFVAGFIGDPSMNFFELEREGDALVGSVEQSSGTRESSGSPETHRVSEDSTNDSSGRSPREHDGLHYSLSEETREAIGDVRGSEASASTSERGGRSEGVERVTLGVRPEDLELVPRKESDHDFPATVDVVEPMGNENNVYLTFDPDVDEPRRFVVTTPGTQQVEQGSEVIVRIPEDAVHLFDGDTGVALRNRKLDSAETVRQ